MPLREALDAIQLIHQAFQQGYENAQQKKKQSSDIDLAQKEHDRRMQELEIHKKEADQTLKYQQAQVDHMHFQKQSQILELLKSGALLGNQEQISQEEPGFILPTGQQMPAVPAQTRKAPVTFGGETVNNYQTPDEVTQQQLTQQKTLITGLAPLQQQIAAQAKTAELNAEEPFKISAEKRTVAGKIAENAPTLQNQKEIARLAQEGENTRAHLAASTSRAGQNIAAQTQRYVAQANNFMLPEQQEGLTKQATNLFAGIDTTPPTGKAKEAIQLIGAKSGMVLPDKKDVERLKTIPQAIDTIQMVRNFAINYGGNDKVQQWAKGKLAESELPSEIKSALATINTRAIGFSKAFEGTQGIRFTNQDLKLVLGGMVNPGNTSKNNEILAGNLDKMVNFASSVTLGKYGAEQRSLLMDTYGLDDFLDKGGNLNKGITRPMDPKIEALFKEVPLVSKVGGALQKNKTLANYLKTGKFTPIYK